MSAQMWPAMYQWRRRKYPPQWSPSHQCSLNHPRISDWWRELMPSLSAAFLVNHSQKSPGESADSPSAMMLGKMVCLSQKQSLIYLKICCKIVVLYLFSFENDFAFFRHRISIDEFNGHCSLVISNCKPDDAGDYTCTAINFAGETNSTAVLLPAEGIISSDF